MRTAVFSDVHGNLEALEAVVAAARERGVDRWVCLGDVVGYGADPLACLQRVADLAQVMLLGNHDAAVAGTLTDEYFNRYAQQAVAWTRRALPPDGIDVLRDLALRHVEADAHYVHAEPGSPEDWNYVCDAGDAARAFGVCRERLVFVGHSHEAFVCAGDRMGAQMIQALEGRVPLGTDRRYLVNAGSVGQPRDGDPRACLAIHDDDADAVELVRVAYDIPAAAAKIRDAGLPGFLALRLEQGC